ncbi:GIY-YIG nuclease family protein [Methanobacterium lacus]|nr:hypothetical protein [Methanobacterium lacus]
MNDEIRNDFNHKGVVYQAFNTKSSINVSEWKCYIGATEGMLKEAMAEHKQCSTDSSFHNAIREYGFDAFKWEIIHFKEDWETMEDLENLRRQKNTWYVYQAPHQIYIDSENDYYQKGITHRTHQKMLNVSPKPKNKFVLKNDGLNDEEVQHQLSYLEKQVK